MLKKLTRIWSRGKKTDVDLSQKGVDAAYDYLYDLGEPIPIMLRGAIVTYLNNA